METFMIIVVLQSFKNPVLVGSTVQKESPSKVISKIQTFRAIIAGMDYWKIRSQGFPCRTGDNSSYPQENLWSDIWWILLREADIRKSHVMHSPIKYVMTNFILTKRVYSLATDNEKKPSGLPVFLLRDKLAERTTGDSFGYFPFHETTKENGSSAAQHPETRNAQRGALYVGCSRSLSNPIWERPVFRPEYNDVCLWKLQYLGQPPVWWPNANSVYTYRQLHIVI